MNRMNPLNELSSASPLSPWLSLSLIAAGLLACEDDSTPKLMEPISNPAPSRDMTAPPESRADASLPDEDMVAPDEPDTSMPPPPTGPPCTEGELRLKEPCGYERCRLGEWVEPSSYRESCNDHDDDCDGTTDETFNVGVECFTRVEGCSTSGAFACDPATLSVMCVPGEDQGPDMELCDGVDNDCDNMVDEDFPDQVCCTEDIHCATGATCVDGLCEGQTIDPTNPGDPTDENRDLEGDGTCSSPIRLGGYGTYYADASNAENTSYVTSCTGVSDDDELITGGTLLGREVVFTLNLPQTQRVRLSTPLTFFDNVIYVRRGACADLFGTAEHCDDSKPLASTPEIATVEFEAQANQTYYVIVDTTLNIFELLEVLGETDLGDIPFILTFEAVQ